MPVSVTWYDEQQTIRYWHFEGHWSWADLRLELTSSAPMVETRGPRVDAIMDFTDSQVILAGWMSELRSITPRAASNIRLVAVVTTNPFLLTVVTIFKTVNPRPRIRIVASPTVEAALAAIAADRAPRRAKTGELSASI